MCVEEGWRKLGVRAREISSLCGERTRRCVVDFVPPNTRKLDADAFELSRLRERLHPVQPRDLMVASRLLPRSAIDEPLAPRASAALLNSPPHQPRRRRSMRGVRAWAVGSTAMAAKADVATETPLAANAAATTMLHLLEPRRQLPEIPRDFQRTGSEDKTRHRVGRTTWTTSPGRPSGNNRRPSPQGEF